MIRHLQTIDRSWRAPAPAERLALLRISIGTFAIAYLLARAGRFTNLAALDPAEFHPVGVARLLQAPMSPAIAQTLFAATLAAGLAFVLGLRFRLTGPLFAALLLWVTSYRNGWGVLRHAQNLMVLHVLVLGLVRSADALSIDARAAKHPPPDSRYGWPIRLLAAMLVLTYVIAGVAKLRSSGAAWLSGDLLRYHVAAESLRELAMDDTVSPLGGAIVRQSWPWRPLAIFTLAVELGAPLALIDRRAARAWVAAAWLFHLGIFALMSIGFSYPLSGVAFAPLFPVERLLDLPLVRRLRAPAHGA